MIYSQSCPYTLDTLYIYRNKVLNNFFSFAYRLRFKRFRKKKPLCWNVLAIICILKRFFVRGNYMNFFKCLEYIASLELSSSYFTFTWNLSTKLPTSATFSKAGTKM